MSLEYWEIYFKQSEKPFQRAGFQNDNKTYIQEISRMRQNESGKHYYHPPEPKTRLATLSGPFEVEKVSRVMVILAPNKKRRCYFEAKGKLASR